MNSNEFDVVVDEKSQKVIHVHFKNSNKKLTIRLTDGTNKADETELMEDCPDVTIESNDVNIYLNTPSGNDLF